MSVGMGLLHTIVTNNINMSVLEDNGVTSNHFISDERQAYEFIISYLEEYQRFPAIRTIEVETKVKFQAFPNEPVEYWIRQVHDRLDAKNILSSNQLSNAAIQNGDIDSAKQVIRSLYDRLQREDLRKSTTTLKDLAPKIVELHDKRQVSCTMSGVPFGFDYIDRISDGAQGGDFISIIGRPSVGKSYILFSMILQAYGFGYMPLVFSLEMSDIQCARRLLALYSNVTATAIRFGKLSHWGRLKLLDRVSRLPSDFIFPIVSRSLDITVESIGDKIREIKPDAVYIDGAYLLSLRSPSRSKWEKVSDAAEYLKRYASKYQIPIIASYQFNRHGAGNLSNIGLSDAIGQLSSIAFSIDDEKDMSAAAPRGIVYKTLGIMKGREGERGKIILLYDMLQMRIEQHEIVEDYSMGDD